MSNNKKLFDFEILLNSKYSGFNAVPSAALKNKPACEYMWRLDRMFAVTLIYGVVAEDLAHSLFYGFTKLWEKYQLEKPVVISKKDKKKWDEARPNTWLRNRIDKIKRSAMRFPVDTMRLKSDAIRTVEAQLWSLKCINLGKACADDGLPVVAIAEQVMALAKKWRFKPLIGTNSTELLEGEASEDYAFRKDEELAEFQLKRLFNEKWWKKQIENAYRQFCEHCQIIAGRVRKGTSEYLSAAGRSDYKARRSAGYLALSKMIALNELTGESIPMLDVVKKSLANDTLKRNELMTRMAGFQALAEELNYKGGFFTLTSPSRFHACTTISGKKYPIDNIHYKGATPSHTQRYMTKVWSRVRSKLGRLNIPYFGIRVCEPHHDGTPHWHCLFFFKPEHEQIIFFTIADHFARSDGKKDLGVDENDFKRINKFINLGLTPDEQFLPEWKEERKHLWKIRQRIKRRVDYKRMDPKKGTATAYIAKYIAKNIDGFNMLDDEETGTPANEKATAVKGWASCWRIRQFQQIGGAPVSVWRELRRLEQTIDEKADMNARNAAKKRGEKYVSTLKIKSYIDLQKENDSIELARISANKGSWAMYNTAMGGVCCPRTDRPIQMVYRKNTSHYGEVVKKLKGIGNELKTMLTRAEGWVIIKDAGKDDGLKNRRASALGTLSVTVRSEQKQEVRSLLLEKGEAVTEAIIEQLLNFEPVKSADRTHQDVRTISWLLLKKNYLNYGGNYHLETWQDKIKQKVKYVNAPDYTKNANRVKFAELLGRGQLEEPLTFDEALLEIQQNNLPPVVHLENDEVHISWEEIQANAAKNGVLRLEGSWSRITN